MTLFTGEAVFLFQINLISVWTSERGFFRPASISFDKHFNAWQFIPLQLNNSKLKIRGTRLWHKWVSCVHFSLPGTTNPVYIQQLTEVILSPIQIFMSIRK
jgi:hypothetical protein